MVPRAEPVILFYVHSLPNTMEPQSRAVTPMLYDANNQSFNIPRPLQDFQHLKITWKILAKSPKVPRSVGVMGTQESFKKISSANSSSSTKAHTQEGKNKN